MASFDDAFVRDIGKLRAEHLAHRVANLKHSANPCAYRTGYRQRHLAHAAQHRLTHEERLVDEHGLLACVDLARQRAQRPRQLVLRESEERVEPAREAAS